MSFQQGLSGLNASAKSLDAISNNVANSGTVGFKSSQAQFADVFAASLTGGGATQVGIGTTISSMTQQFTQGNINVTNNPMDVAINGAGFFRMDNNGSITYTRNGQFQVDKDGYIVNSSAYRLTGFLADANGNILQSSPTPITIGTEGSNPKATGTASIQMNLDSREEPPASAVFSINNPQSYNKSSSISIYDSLGNPHILTLYFVKTSTAGEWEVQGCLDGAATAAGVPIGITGLPTDLDYDTSGQLTTVMPLATSIDLTAVMAALGKTNNAAATLPLNVDFTDSTQFGSTFGVNSLIQDGFTSGKLSGISIDAAGVIQGRYSNGKSRNLAQVVLANFNNPNGLQALGGNQWGATAMAGPEMRGEPGTGRMGVLQPAALEESNVDLTAELVNMITAQRNYQANAQSIKTQDQVMQTLVNLR